MKYKYVTIKSVENGFILSRDVLSGSDAVFITAEALMEELTKIYLPQAASPDAQPST